MFIVSLSKFLSPAFDFSHQLVERFCDVHFCLGRALHEFATDFSGEFFTFFFGYFSFRFEITFVTNQHKWYFIRIFHSEYVVVEVLHFVKTDCVGDGVHTKEAISGSERNFRKREEEGVQNLMYWSLTALKSSCPKETLVHRQDVEISTNTCCIKDV